MQLSKPNTKPAESPKPSTGRPETAKEKAHRFAEMMVRNLNEATSRKAETPSQTPAK